MDRRVFERLICSVNSVLCTLAFALLAAAVHAAEILPVDQAFRWSVTTETRGEAVFRWTIDDCCYLYRDKFKFAAKTPEVELGSPHYPPGETKHDEFFGDMEVYRGGVEIRVPVTLGAGIGDDFQVEFGYQGCSDQGICYPPQKRVTSVTAGPPTSTSGDGPSAATFDQLAQALESLGARSASGDLLPADQAFRFAAEVRDAHTIKVGWQIAEGYYLYREKFQFRLLQAGDVRLGAYEIPRGEPKLDEEFGSVEVFRGEIDFLLPVLGSNDASTVRLEVGFQGCADRGVCYPPLTKTVVLELPSAETAAGSGPSDPTTPRVERFTAEHDRIAAGLGKTSAWLTVLSFLGFGLLLAFTPCMFPMIPILSGIIVGQGHPITSGRAFMVSLSYVVASAVTYTVFGVLAGLFGSNLQALFQTPWIIVSVSIVFVLLALAMFGFFQLQFPTFIQSRIAAVSSKQSRGSLSGAAIMGALSALVMGPCVAPPLAGALIYIGKTGDAWLGGTALFALGFGMGIPLLILGASAGKLLPKVGIWMNTVRAGFGVGLLAVAVWLLERILPPAAALFLWALLLIIPAIYLGALDALPQPASGWRKLWKGVGVVMLTYGILLLVGVATDANDPLQPLRGWGGGSSARPTEQAPAFERVETVEELEQRLTAAGAQGRWVMLDYYADWCISCKEMERYTFADPSVRTALANVTLLQADVTANSPEDQLLLKRFGLIGPPATLFFGPDRRERTGLRVVGYLDAQQFLEHLRRIPACILEC
jgi:thiol:disulfide interchange protein DsbD